MEGNQIQPPQLPDASDPDAISQFMREINFKLDLIPQLSNSLSGIEAKMNSFSKQLDTTKSEISNDLAEMRNKLRESTLKIDSLEAEIKRYNLVFYNFPVTGPSQSSLKDELCEFLSWCLPNLQLSRRDIKDAFRLRSGPVIVKWHDLEIRNAVLRKSFVLKQNGVGVAPDYTTYQREARKNLKPVLSQALVKGQNARLKGDRLIIEGKTYTYDRECQKIKEMTVSHPIRAPNAAQSNSEIRGINPANVNENNQSSVQNCPSDQSDCSGNESDTNTIVERNSNLPKTIGTGKGRKSSEISPVDNTYSRTARNVRQRNEEPLTSRVTEGNWPPIYRQNTRPFRQLQKNQPWQYRGINRPRGDDYYRLAFPPSDYGAQ